MDKLIITVEGGEGRHTLEKEMNCQKQINQSINE